MTIGYVIEPKRVDTVLRCMLVLVLASIVSLSTAPTADQLAAASKYNAEHGGVSFLVIHQGKKIAENYPGRGSETRTWELASGTKSFTGVMALCAQEDGLLKLDEPVSKTITEWQADDRREITIRQLLSLVSGIPGREERGLALQVPSYSEAINAHAKFKPGARFQYGPTPFMAFGELMRRKLLPNREGVLQYLERRVFKPLTMQHGFWKLDRDGNPHLPSGAHMSAREWSKFGLMILAGGKGVLKSESVNELFRTTKANPSYGLSWWLPAEGGLQPDGFRHWNWPKSLPTDVHVAAGAGGQRLYVVPSRDLIVVRQAPIRVKDDFEDADFLSKLFLR